MVVLQWRTLCVWCRNLVLFLPSETEPIMVPFRAILRFVVSILYPEELTTAGMWVTLGLEVTRPRNACTVLMLLTTLLLT